MAYRTFEQSPTYIQPEVDFFPKTLAIIQAGQVARQRQQLQNRSLAATYQADKLASKFNVDQEKLNHFTSALTKNGTSDYYNYGRLSPATQDMATRGQGYAQSSAAQWQTKEDTENAIKSKVFRGPKGGVNYYDPTHDQAIWTDANYGRADEEVDYSNRGDRQKATLPKIGTNLLLSLNKEAFLNDYVDEKKTQIRQSSNKYQSGIKSGEKIEAVFYDSNGVPGVTEKDAIELLDSNEYIKEYYKQKVDTQLLDDARRMVAASKDAAWLKELTPDQIVQQFRENPALNTEATMKPGERERQLAKQDLEKRQRVSLDNSYDAGEYRDETGLGIKNNKVAHSSTFHQDDFPGVGGVLILTTGKNFTIPSTSPDRTDLSTGTTSHSMRGKRDFAVEGYELVPTWNNNEPVNLQAKNADEFIKAINDLPANYFNPASPKYVSGLRIGLKGTSIDKAKLVQKAYDEEKSLNKRIAEAVIANNPDEVANLEKQRESIKKINSFMGMEELTPEQNSEFQSLLPFLGIEGIEHNELVLANPADLANVKAVTGGFDPSNPKNWNADMVRVQNAFNKKRQEAQAAGYKQPAAKSAKLKTEEHEDREQNGNIFTWNPKTGKYEFLRKK